MRAVHTRRVRALVGRREELVSDEETRQRRKCLVQHHSSVAVSRFLNKLEKVGVHSRGSELFVVEDDVGVKRDGKTERKKNEKETKMTVVLLTPSLSCSTSAAPELWV